MVLFILSYSFSRIKEISPLPVGRLCVFNLHLCRLFAVPRLPPLLPLLPLVPLDVFVKVLETDELLPGSGRVFGNAAHHLLRIELVHLEQDATADLPHQRRRVLHGRNAKVYDVADVVKITEILDEIKHKLGLANGLLQHFLVLGPETRRDRVFTRNLNIELGSFTWIFAGTEIAIALKG